MSTSIQALADSSEERAWQQASHDALTGLPNRRLFGERLDHELRRARRNGQRLALLAVELDHFKAITEGCDRSVGDALLAEAGRRIAGCVREVDMVARLDGDRFVVLLGELTDEPGDVERIARQLIARLAQPYDRLPPGAAQPTASIGISLCPEDANEAQPLHLAAEQALLAAKAGGRRGFRFHRPRLQAAAHAHEQLGAELQLALQRGQLQLHFRPIQCCGKACPLAEVLLRWQHPQLGLLRPRSFMATAEAAGLMDAIADWLLAEVSRALQRWQPLAPSLQLTLRPSLGQLHRWSRSLPDWAARLRELGFGDGRLLLELDETLLREPALQALLQRPALQAAGVRLLLADFGQGLAALSSLEHPGLSALRLAAERVQRVGSARGLAWLQAVSGLAIGLGLQVQAGGVLDAEQQQALRGLGIDALLGPGVAAPLDEAGFQTWLASAAAAVGNP